MSFPGELSVDSPERRRQHLAEGSQICGDGENFLESVILQNKKRYI